MSVSPDHVLAAEPVGRSLLTQRARFCMDAISDIMTTSDPHFVISLEPDLVSSGQGACQCAMKNSCIGIIGVVCLLIFSVHRNVLLMGLIYSFIYLCPFIQDFLLGGNIW